MLKFYSITSLFMLMKILF